MTSRRHGRNYSSDLDVEGYIKELVEQGIDSEEIVQRTLGEFNLPDTPGAQKQIQLSVRYYRREMSMPPQEISPQRQGSSAGVSKQLVELRSRYRNAGIRVAAGMYEVFSTAPTNLHLWKQVPTSEEAVQLAKQLVQQHEESVLNVWHHDEGHIYQVENRDGQVNELISAPTTLKPAPEKERPTVPTMRGDWPEQMSDRGQQRYSSPDMPEGNYWVRLGDGGEYEEFKVLQEVTEHLLDWGAGPVLGWRGYGVETEDFQGNNYISLYVGDENADPIRDLSTEEKSTVESALTESRPVYGVFSPPTRGSFQYKSLEDAADVTGDSRYRPGVAKVWYVGPEFGRDYRGGFDDVIEYGRHTPSKRSVQMTHEPIGSVDSNDPEEIFEMMQAFNWSPNGEAHDLIQSKGLHHTSMSVGDVVEIGDTYYFVDRNGFIELEDLSTPVEDVKPNPRIVEELQSGAPKALVDGKVYRPVAMPPRRVPEGLEDAIGDSIRYYDEGMSQQRGMHPEALREMVRLRTETKDFLERVKSGQLAYDESDLQAMKKAVQNAIAYLEGAYQIMGRNPEAMQWIHDKRRRLEDLLKKVNRMRPRSAAAEPVDDVGFDGFVGVFDPDKDKKRKDALQPEWVLEKVREESMETIPEVVDEDLVKVHG